MNHWVTNEATSGKCRCGQPAAVCSERFGAQCIICAFWFNSDPYCSPTIPSDPGKANPDWTNIVTAWVFFLLGFGFWELSNHWLDLCDFLFEGWK